MNPAELKRENRYLLDRDHTRPCETILFKYEGVNKYHFEKTDGEKISLSFTDVRSYVKRVPRY